MSKFDLIFSPIYRSFTYPVWLWCIMFGITFLIPVAITLDITFVSSFTKEIRRHFSIYELTIKKNINICYSGV